MFGSNACTANAGQQAERAYVRSCAGAWGEGGWDAGIYWIAGGRIEVAMKKHRRGALISHVLALVGAARPILLRRCSMQVVASALVVFWCAAGRPSVPKKPCICVVARGGESPSKNVVKPPLGVVGDPPSLLRSPVLKSSGEE